MTLGEFRGVLHDLGLLGLAEWHCTQEGATLADAHGPGEMRHQRRARVRLYELLHAKWSRAKIADAFNRKAIRLPARGRAA
jgi:hypothetical protein